LEIVCDDLAAHPTLSASINVSPRQLVAPTFVPELIEAMLRRGISPSRLEVELTEQVVVDDPWLAARCLRDLHEAGFTTALDDFGTGYSSIGYLRQMEFDALKIDRSFVSGFPGEPSRLALLDAMIQAAHALGLKVVCEGIETAEEMDLLYDLGCDLAQGWHLDRPMAIEALATRWLAPEVTAVRVGVA
jgi:EAL domain-containing protein (putative c-di-GMP-specific phosphodiesterase class I)